MLANGLLGLEGCLISEADPVTAGGGGRRSSIGSTNATVMGQDGPVRAESIQDGIELGRIGVTIDDYPRCVGVGVVRCDVGGWDERSFSNS